MKFLLIAAVLFFVLAANVWFYQQYCTDPGGLLHYSDTCIALRWWAMVWS